MPLDGETSSISRRKIQRNLGRSWKEICARPIGKLLVSPSLRQYTHGWNDAKSLSRPSFLLEPVLFCYILRDVWVRQPQPLCVLVLLVFFFFRMTANSKQKEMTTHTETGDTRRKSNQWKCVSIFLRRWLCEFPFFLANTSTMFNEPHSLNPILCCQEYRCLMTLPLSLSWSSLSLSDVNRPFPRFPAIFYIYYSFFFVFFSLLDFSSAKKPSFPQ